MHDSEVTGRANSTVSKTGGGGGAWIRLDRPKPPKVDDVIRYWAEVPPQASDRCVYWLEQVAAGWRPNRRISQFGYHEKAEWYGVYIWEYLRVLQPFLTYIAAAGPRPR